MIGLNENDNRYVYYKHGEQGYLVPYQLLIIVFSVVQGFDRALCLDYDRHVEKNQEDDVDYWDLDGLGMCYYIVPQSISIWLLDMLSEYGCLDRQSG